MPTWKEKWEWMEQGKIPEDVAKANPTLHFCMEWDELLIEETDGEFDYCHCFRESK